MQSRFNATAYFILPLIGDGINSTRFGEMEFNNAYISPDYSSIVVEVSGLPRYNYKDDAYYKRDWYSANGFQYIEYYVPTKYNKDVLLILHGMYSSVSDEASMKIMASIKLVELLNTSSEEIENELYRRLQKWPHLVGFHTKDGKYILPDIYIAMMKPSSPLKRAFKERLEQELDAFIPDDIDLFEIPNLRKEIIDINTYIKSNSADKVVPITHYESYASKNN